MKINVQKYWRREDGFGAILGGILGSGTALGILGGAAAGVGIAAGTAGLAATAANLVNGKGNTSAGGSAGGGGGPTIGDLLTHLDNTVQQSNANLVNDVDQTNALLQAQQKLDTELAALGLGAVALVAALFLHKKKNSS